MLEPKLTGSSAFKAAGKFWDRLLLSVPKCSALAKKPLTDSINRSRRVPEPNALTEVRRPSFRECSAFQAKRQLRVFVIGCRTEFLIEQARLDVRIVLVLAAGVLADIANDLMVENLADFNAGVNSDRLNGEHLQRPVPAESDITETGGHVHEQTKPPDGGPPLNHGNEIFRFGTLDRTPQVQPMRLKYQSGFRNFHSPCAIGLFHVQNDFLVRHDLIVQGQVVAVGIDSIRQIRVNFDV